MDQSELEKPQAWSAFRSWAIVLPIAIAALVLPIALAIGGANRGPTKEEQVKGLAAEVQAHARVALVELRTARRSLDDFLQSPPPPADWPADGLAAYNEFVDMCRSEQGKFAYRESVYERVIAGEQSPELDEALQSLAKEMTPKAQLANDLNARIQAADKEWQAAREQAQRLAEEKHKRETGEGLGMTMQGFLFLKEGMSKWEVDLILDCTGELSVQSESHSIYHWRNGLSGVNCTFHRGELVSKAQFGL